MGIHCCVILNLWALLSNRWASKLARFHGHIVVCLQMPYQVVLGCIQCIIPVNPTNKFGRIPCPMDTLYGNWRRGNYIWNQKKNTINLMWEFTFWMKVISTWWGYFHYRQKIKHTMTVLQKWIDKQKFKMKVLQKPNLEICIEWG